MKKIIILGFCIALAAVVGAVYLVVIKTPSEPGSSKLKSPFRTPTSSTEPQVSDATSRKAPEKLPLPPRPADQDKVIKEIRGELQIVMDLNKKINSVQQSRSSQLLRIQEQAQMHQKILEEIQKISLSKESKVPSRETLLAQEKLRIIRQETLRSKKILEESARKPAV